MTDASTNGFGLPLARPAAPVAEPVAAPVPTPAPAPVAAPTLVAAPPAAVSQPPAAAPAPGGAARPVMLDDLLQHVLAVGASDLHLTQGAPPTVRLRGEMEAIEGCHGAVRVSSCAPRSTAS